MGLLIPTVKDLNPVVRVGGQGEHICFSLGNLHVGSSVLWCASGNEILQEIMKVI